MSSSSTVITAPGSGVCVGGSSPSLGHASNYITPEVLGELSRKALITVSGPSGSGKDTIIQTLARRRSDIGIVVTSTTRQPREGMIKGEYRWERPGEDFHFYPSAEAFEKDVRAGNILEYDFNFGNYYGTSLGALRHVWSDHRFPILNISLRGTEQLRRVMPRVMSVFVRVPIQNLEERIRTRGKLREEVIQQRLHEARWENENSLRYCSHEVVNDVPGCLEKPVEQLSRIVDTTLNLYRHLFRR